MKIPIPPLLAKKITFIVVSLLCIITVAPSLTHAQKKHEPIKIAAIFSLTGVGAHANRSSVLGTRLAVNEINNNGGIFGRKINLILLDNMSTPIGSSIAANQAVEANVSGIIGSQWSSHSLAIAKVAQENSIPMISNFSTHPDLTKIGEYIFRICFTDRFQGKIMAEFAWEDLQAKKAVVFVDLTSDYSLALSQIFIKHFKILGGTITREIEYKKKEDYDEVAKKSLGIDGDIIFLSGHEESGVIASNLQKAGEKAIFLGGDGWGDSSFLEFGGNTLKQAYFCTHWSQDSDNVASLDFYTKYHQLKDFGTGAALAFDAVKVLAAAITDAGSTDTKAIVESLSTLQSHQGVTGSIQFNSLGNPVKSAVIMKIEHGKPRYYKSFSPIERR